MGVVTQPPLSCVILYYVWKIYTNPLYSPDVFLSHFTYKYIVSNFSLISLTIIRIVKDNILYLFCQIQIWCAITLKYQVWSFNHMSDYCILWRLNKFVVVFTIISKKNKNKFKKFIYQLSKYTLKVIFQRTLKFKLQYLFDGYQLGCNDYNLLYNYTSILENWYLVV